MAVLVGIDEAGYGPILGPLVVSACGFRMPREMLGMDLWQLLSASTTKRAGRGQARLVIADSKQLYNRKKGLKNLQRCVLSLLRIQGREPQTLDEMLRLLCPACVERLASYPWYEQIAGYGIRADNRDINIAAKVLRDDLGKNGVEFTGLRSFCLDVGRYNRFVAGTNNKSSVLFTATCSLVLESLDKSDHQEAHIVIDRQGGRTRYRPHLQRMFAHSELTILKETAGISSYRLCTGEREIFLHFVTKADQRYLPVSIGSMVSKYIRELLIDNINRYFQRQLPELKPTAGYWQDGQRFLRDLRENGVDITAEEKLLIRSR